LIINFAYGGVAAFSVGFDQFFYRSQPVPQLFDKNLQLQLVPNIDGWFQARTHQRHSYRGFLDMIAAFEAGLRHTYSLEDLQGICNRAALAAKSFILTQRMGDYGKLFWVEVLDPAKLDAHAATIREKFGHLTKTLGEDKFYNNLCRLWKFSTHHSPKMAGIFEKFIRRLGRVPEEPSYPTSDELDKELQKSVLMAVLEREAVYKGVPREIQEKVGALIYVQRGQAVQT
jgi:hypothetical protein